MKEHGHAGERLSPTHRIIRCRCGWYASLPRRNGAWMTLKKYLRLHIEGAGLLELSLEEKFAERVADAGRAAAKDRRRVLGIIGAEKKR